MSRRARPGSWQTLASVEGTGPIAMARSGEIVITVRFACPTARTHDQYTAKAVIVGTSVQAPVVASVNICATGDRVGSPAS
jgi:hypothetical protein